MASCSISEETARKRYSIPMIVEMEKQPNLQFNFLSTPAALWSKKTLPVPIPEISHIGIAQDAVITLQVSLLQERLLLLKRPR